MTKDELDKRVERTLRLNREAIERANRRGEKLNREAERSAVILDRAFRQLRQNLAR
jgi:hypothetical protein